MTAAIVTLIAGVIIVCVSFFIIDGHNYKEEDEIYSETSDELRRRLMDLSDDLYRKYRENVKSLNEELRIKLERKILIELEKYAGQLSEKAKNEMISYINESLADAFAAYNTDDNAEPKEITYDAEEDAPVMKLDDEVSETAASETVPDETVTSENAPEEQEASEETPEEPVVSETVPEEQDTEEQVQAEEAVASGPASEISETTPEAQPAEEQTAEEPEMAEVQSVDEQIAAEPEMPEAQAQPETPTVNEQQVQHNNGKKKKKKKNKNRNNNTKPEISEAPVIEPEKIWDEEEDMEKKVMELSENGCSIMEIANQLGIGVGEAKTILNRQK